MSLLWDWHIPICADLLADASAALGIIGRSGLGKMRHIDTSYLWLQQESIKEKIKMLKVLGTENPADMNTKGLSGDEINKYIDMLSMKFEEGRAELAPDLVSHLRSLHCNRFNSTTKKVTHRVRFEKNVYNSNNKRQINECFCTDRYCQYCSSSDQNTA